MYFSSFSPLLQPASLFGDAIMYIINHILSTAEFSSSGSVVGGERRNKNKMKIRWQWQNNKKKMKESRREQKKV